MRLTCEDDDEDDADVNEEELEVSQVAEILQYQKSHAAAEELIYNV